MHIIPCTSFEALCFRLAPSQNAIAALTVDFVMVRGAFRDWKSTSHHCKKHSQGWKMTLQWCESIFRYRFILSRHCKYCFAIYKRASIGRIESLDVVFLTKFYHIRQLDMRQLLLWPDCHSGRNRFLPVLVLLQSLYFGYNECWWHTHCQFSPK